MEEYVGTYVDYFFTMLGSIETLFVLIRKQSGTHKARLNKDKHIVVVIRT